MQIILLALVLGVCAAAGYFLVSGPIHQQPGAAGDSLPIVSIVAAAMFVTNTVLSFVLPGIITQGALTRLLAEAGPSGDVDELEAAAALVQSRQTGLIVSAALLEAAAMTAIVAYLLEGQTWVFGIVAGAILLMLAQFPGVTRLRAWLDVHFQRLRELRQETQLRP
jgi:hypothetical protein